MEYVRMKKPHDPRHNARRVALQTLFKWSYRPQGDVLQSLNAVVRELEGSEDFNADIDTGLTQTLLSGTATQLDELDAIIAQAAPEWPLNQIARVDLAILRLAIYEILHHRATPPKVAIDEAVELAKEFGGDNSPSFVNGVLGTVMEIRENTGNDQEDLHEK